MKTVIIGAGNVAFHLAPALKKSGHEILQVYSRSHSSAAELAERIHSFPVTDLKAISAEADFYLICLRDEILPNVIREISFNPKLIAHTSGSTGMDVFPLHFPSAGIIYPLQTFSKNRPMDLSSVPFCIEANTREAEEELKKIGERISQQVHLFNDELRLRLHVSAVIASNFSNHLYSIAFELLKEKNLPESLLYPLIKETMEKALQNGPDHAQTGPARRSDATIIEKHLEVLSSHPDYQKIYRMLSDSILKKFGKSL